MNTELNNYDEYGETPIRNDRPSPFKRNLSIVRRHVWIVIAMFVIVATFGLLRAYKATPMYNATAKLLVERQSPNVTKLQGVMQSAPAWGPEYYKTQEGLLVSRAVLEVALENPEIRELFEDVSGEEQKKRTIMSRLRRTIPALLGIPPSDPPEPWERLASYVRPKHVHDTQFIRVNINSSNKDLASKLANAVADAFVKYHIVRRLEISNDVFFYLQDQKQKEEQAIIEAQEALQDYRENLTVSTIDSRDSSHPVLSRLASLNSHLTDTQLQRIEIEAQYRVAKQALEAGGRANVASAQQLFSLSALFEDGTTATMLKNSIVDAEQRLAVLSETYGPRHPQIEQLESQIEHMRTTFKDSLGDALSSMSTRIEMLAQEEQELEMQHKDQNVLALELAKGEIMLNRLQNDLDRHERLYDVLVERMSEVELTTDYARTNVEVIERASVPKAPFGPNKRRMAAISLILGVVLGVGLAFVIERIDDTVRTPEDLEIDVGVSVLGFVPEIVTKKDCKDGSAYRGLISALEPHSSAIEAYRNIRTALFFSAPAEEAKVLLVTSAGPSDGKTTTATNLALTIAQSGKRVLLIDADLRRPRVHKTFGLSGETGFSSVLVGEATLEDAIQKTMHDVENIDKLDILTAGPKGPNPTELFESSSATKLFTDLRKRYDRIIIDTPPALFVSDTSILSTVCDGIILVAKAGKNTKAHVARAKKQLESVDAKIIGSILNSVKVSRLSHYYSDYFYHGYARYYRDYYGSYYTDRKKKRKGKGKASETIGA